MSPAAAVVAMSSKLAYVPPSSLIRQVVLPLAIGGATLLVALLARYKFSLPRPLVVDVASSFLVALGVFWFVSRSYA